MPANSSGMQGPEKDKFNFSKGQTVRIVDGTFAEYIGTVSESDREQKKVTVLISFFGKITPVVLNFFQVEKTEPFLT